MTPAQTVPQAGPPTRIASIDTCRVIAILAVICVHTHPFMERLFPAIPYRLPEYILTQWSRFAVLFFFMVAGHFLGRVLKAQDRWARVLRYEKRLLVLLLAWSLLYFLIPSYWPDLLEKGYAPVLTGKIQELWSSPFETLFQGGRVHLWFLVSLMQGVMLLALCTTGGRTWPAVLLALFLFVVGLLGGSYTATPLGFQLPFYTRNGPFTSMICLTIGYLTYTKKLAVSPRPALLVIAAGLSLQSAETWYLWRCCNWHWLSHDYLLGTLVTAGGVLLYALARPDFGRRSKLHTLGQYTLGVYLCHLMFVDLLGPFTLRLELHLWQGIFPLTVYLLSIALTAMLARLPWIKTLVA